MMNEEDISKAFDSKLNTTVSEQLLDLGKNINVKCVMLALQAFRYTHDTDPSQMDIIKDLLNEFSKRFSNFMEIFFALQEMMVKMEIGTLPEELQEEAENLEMQKKEHYNEEVEECLKIFLDASNIRVKRVENDGEVHISPEDWSSNNEDTDGEEEEDEG